MEARHWWIGSGVATPLVARLLLAALMIAGAGTSSAFAQEALTVRGTFALDSLASDDIGEAIAEGTKDMGFTGRIARGRLNDTNPLYRTIEIDATADSVKLTFDRSTVLATAATGEETEWMYNGERFKVSTRWESGAVRQTFTSIDGTRENVTTLDPDGSTLRVVTTVTSGILPAPISYTLVYRREEG